MERTGVATRFPRIQREARRGEKEAAAVIRIENIFFTQPCS
jgi:hypothetical protein